MPSFLSASVRKIFIIIYLDMEGIVYLKWTHTETQAHPSQISQLWVSLNFIFSIQTRLNGTCYISASFNDRYFVELLSQKYFKPWKTPETSSRPKPKN